MKKEGAWYPWPSSRGLYYYKCMRLLKVSFEAVVQDGVDQLAENYGYC